MSRWVILILCLTILTITFFYAEKYETSPTEEWESSQIKSENELAIWEKLDMTEEEYNKVKASWENKAGGFDEVGAPISEDGCRARGGESQHNCAKRAATKDETDKNNEVTGIQISSQQYFEALEKNHQKERDNPTPSRERDALFSECEKARSSGTDPLPEGCMPGSADGLEDTDANIMKAYENMNMFCVTSSDDNWNDSM